MTGSAQRRDPEQPVRINAEQTTLEGDLGIPEGARGVVLFAYGSGSSRHRPRVQAPTLLIVRGDDTPVTQMNREAMAQMSGEVKLEIVPGASPLFEEPGAIETVAALARDWFLQHLGSPRRR